MSDSSIKETILNMSLEDKRKLYKCGKAFTELENISTWGEMSSGNGQQGENPRYSVNKELNERVSVFTGDITTLEIDAIVNAANCRLLGGGGAFTVDNAIHRAAGILMTDECRTLNGCKTGEAKITGGYNLPARYVIHTPGPIGEIPQQLQDCYQNCFQLMIENGLRTIAFPCISTGAYGYPSASAAGVALKTTRDFLEKGSNAHQVDRVIFCLFSPVDTSIYDKLLRKYFPTD